MRSGIVGMSQSTSRPSRWIYLVLHYLQAFYTAVFTPTGGRVASAHNLTHICSIKFKMYFFLMVKLGVRTRKYGSILANNFLFQFTLKTCLKS